MRRALINHPPLMSYFQRIFAHALSLYSRTSLSRRCQPQTCGKKCIRRFGTIQIGSLIGGGGVLCCGDTKVTFANRKGGIIKTTYEDKIFQILPEIPFRVLPVGPAIRFEICIEALQALFPNGKHSVHITPFQFGAEFYCVIKSRPSRVMEDVEAKIVGFDSNMNQTLLCRVNPGGCSYVPWAKCGSGGATIDTHEVSLTGEMDFGDTHDEIVRLVDLAIQRDRISCGGPKRILHVDKGGIPIVFKVP